ncbi:MAG: alkaline phosphatase family protein [Candidatus Limnocylindrales bacterium]
MRVGNPAVALALVVVAVALALAMAWLVADQLGPTPSPGGPASSSATLPVAATSSAGAASSAPAASPATGTATPSTSASGASAAGPVFVIVLENKEAEEIVGNRQAPYFNELAAHFGLATGYHAVAHPSQPNYLALWSGSTQGVLDDGVHDLSAPTIADQLERSGRTWHVFAEHVPGDCFRGASASGGRDGSGTYARKHEPAISFLAVSSAPARCAHISDLSSYAPALADLELVVPDLCHDMHDCSIAVGDAWLRTFVPRILESAAWRDGGLLIVTFDEGGVRNQVATLVIRPGMPAGQRSGRAHDHYGLLRTIEDRFSLPCLAKSCSAVPLSEFLAP